jgi:hypothetical protein
MDRLAIGVLLLVCTICPALTFAQQQAYYRISYYKAIPGKEDELHSMMKSVDVKVQQARIDVNVISGWIFINC